MLDSQKFEQILRDSKYNSRAIMVQVRKLLLEHPERDEIYSCLLRKTIKGIAEVKPLTAISRTLSYYAMRKCKIDKDKYGDVAIISCGCNIIHIFSQMGLVEATKVKLDDKGKMKEQWFLTISTPELTELLQTTLTTSLPITPVLGLKKWSRMTILDQSGVAVPIVKKADRYKVLHWYTEDKIPLVYRVLNRLNETTWKVNKKMLTYLTNPDSLSPPPVSYEDKRIALTALNRINRSYNTIQQQKFLEFNKWLEEKELDLSEEEVVKMSTITSQKQAEEWMKILSFDHNKVISDYSKRSAFESIITLATQWVDSDLNYLYNCDSRGRIYSLTPYLNPQGDDAAKSLLCFNNPKSISVYDFYIHLANCAGEDKGSFEDRIRWVQTHSLAIERVGLNPLGRWEKKWLEASGIVNEKKTKLQFIAAAMEFSRLTQWIRDGNEQDTFLCSIPIGLDSTSSGLQLFSAIGRDADAAPYVNISPHPSGKVGDLYAWLGSKLVDKLSEQEDLSPTLSNLLSYPSTHKVWRKVMKRLGMTYAYSAVAWGMGDMTWEDRKDHGVVECDNLRYSDCKLIGRVAHKICEDNLTQAAKLMDFMRDGINSISTNKALISWRLPSGFTAWQVKDSSTEQTVNTMIGDQEVNLKIYIFRDKPNKRKHKNAISPDIIHSLDAWLLMLIIDYLPQEANLHFIHDNFGTDSSYTYLIQEAAKEAYLTVTDRDSFRSICADAFNLDRPLPSPGTWNREDINNAEYIIC